MQDGTKKISETCKQFTEKTYLQIVALANDLLSYSKDASPADGKLFEEVAKMIDQNNIKDAVTLLTDLQDTANDCKTRAQTQATNLATFNTGLVEALGKLDIAKTALDADKKTNEATINKLAGKGGRGRLARELPEKVNELRDEYKQLVIIAATTPTYAWVWPIGTIPAIVVAGIYTDRAIKKLQQIDAMETDLRKKDASLFAANQARTIYSVGHQGLTDVTTYAKLAHTHCTIVQNAWAGVSGHIADLKKWIGKTTRPVADGGMEPQSKAILKIYLQRLGEAWGAMKPDLVDLTTDPYVAMPPGTKTPGEFADDLKKMAA